jgi:predicted esterase
MNRLENMTRGPALNQSAGLLILLHGRGATAESILTIYNELDRPDISAIAPQAVGRSWYPYSFLAPIPDNQPHLDRALATVDACVQEALANGVPAERIALLGFSQGACLASEYVIRNPRHYGAIMALTGGFVGPLDMVRHDQGDLAGTSVLLAAGDPDPHVPFTRVQDTADLMTRMGAAVDLRRYPGLAHTVNEDELEACKALIEAMAKGA